MKTEVPAYCLGFAIGPLNRCIDRHYGVKFQYLSADYSEKELWQIFEESPAMLRFFERKAGVKYPGTCYAQLLMKGNISQEMHQFAVIRNNYGRQVLDVATDIKLGAHELAHQWWGNQVTCLDWTHFWLNEGMAVFMSSAYREYRFGREAYLEDIAAYRNAYQEVMDKGLDKPLQFPDWDQPTAEDRTLVYYKGAYFLHLLREELGDRMFWKGIRRYTRKYFGKSVVSADLQMIMEKVSRKDLSRLFADWVYQKKR
jgi:aminopeptidase N